MSNLVVRSITGVLFVTIIVVCFMRPLAMILLFALVTGMTIWEFTGLVNEVKGITVNRFINTVAGVYFFFAMAGFCSSMTPPAVFIPYLVTIIYLFISELYTKSENPLHDWAYSMFAQLYIALPFSTINVLAFQSTGTGETAYYYLIPLSVFIFLWVNDSGAYCSGSLLGKHKLFERISPKKSWEGSIGGGIFVIIAAIIISYLETKNGGEGVLSMGEWIGMGLVVVFFGTWGDLVESLFKRTLGIKDSGTILPGHGGMLDRFDSSLMALPAVVIYLYSITLF